MHAILLAMLVQVANQSPAYPPLTEYLMERDAEIALARSAAPQHISSRATVKVLTPSGFQVAAQGGQRLHVHGPAGLVDPDLHARIKRNDPDAIAREVSAAYASGKLPRMEGVAFAYMWSPNQYLGPEAGAWHPHMMIYAPYYTNAMLGGNPFAGSMPFVNDDEGTPFTVIVVAVDGQHH